MIINAAIKLFNLLNSTRECTSPSHVLSAELIYTERAHVRMLRVLDLVFYQKLSKEAILPPADIKNIFTNLEEILQLHGI